MTAKNGPGKGLAKSGLPFKAPPTATLKGDMKGKLGGKTQKGGGGKAPLEKGKKGKGSEKGEKGKKGEQVREIVTDEVDTKKGKGSEKGEKGKKGNEQVCEIVADEVDTKKGKGSEKGKGKKGNEVCEIVADEVDTKKGDDRAEDAKEVEFPKGGSDDRAEHAEEVDTKENGGGDDRAENAKSDAPSVTVTPPPKKRKVDDGPSDSCGDVVVTGAPWYIEHFC